MSEEEFKNIYKEIRTDGINISPELTLIAYLTLKNKELNSIIKEVREYINSNEFIGRIRLSSDNKQAINKLLEILDKVEEKK